MQLKRVLSLTLLLCVSSVVAQAQDDERKTEVFVGFSALAAQNALTNKDIKTFDGLTPAQFRTLAGFDLLDNERFIPAYGIEGNVAHYFSKRVGFALDFSGHRRKATARVADTLFRANHSIYYILAGPQAKVLSGRRASVFLHALAGAARTNVSYSEIGNTNGITANDSSTRFAVALGGGIDLRISNRISARLFQMDYVPMLGKDRRVTASDGTIIDINGRAQQGNFRVSFGIVFK